MIQNYTKFLLPRVKKISENSKNSNIVSTSKKGLLKSVFQFCIL